MPDEKYKKAITNIAEIKAATKGGSVNTDTKNNELVVTKVNIPSVTPKAPQVTVTHKIPVQAASVSGTSELINKVKRIDVSSWHSY